MATYFTPLAKGTIADVFDNPPWWRKNAPAPLALPRSPFDLPSSPSDCVHVEVHIEELSEGVESKISHCPRKADRFASRHGWLCSKHAILMDQLGPKTAPMLRDHFAEQIQAIMNCENKAIEAGPVVKVGIGRFKLKVLDLCAESVLRRPIRQMALLADEREYE